MAAGASLPGDLVLWKSFEAARGQWQETATLFRGRTAQYEVRFETGAVRFLTRDGEIRMLAALGGKLGRPLGVGESVTKSNYFVGDVRVVGAPHFERVRYADVWPGIDLEFRYVDGRVEYDLHVAGGAEPGRIAFRFPTAAKLSKDGEELLIGKAIRQRAPEAYQLIDGKRVRVAARIAIEENEVRFALGEYDRSKALVIDPIVEASTFLLSGADSNLRITAAVDGSPIIGGHLCPGSTAPVPNPNSGFAPSPNGACDVFVARLTPDMKLVTFFTYLGGAQDDYFGAIDRDSAGNIILAGVTASANFPTTAGALRTTITPPSGVTPGTNDAFITKLNSTGTQLVFSTFHGSPGNDFSAQLAVDANSNIIVAGYTNSTAFPTTGGVYRPTYSGTGFTGWITKLPPSGAPAAFTTYFFSSTLSGLATDSAGNVFIADVQGINGNAAIVTKMPPDGSLVSGSMGIGITGLMGIAGIAIDSTGNVYIAGNVTGTGFPATVTHTPVVSGSHAYAVKFNNALTATTYAAAFGGRANAIQVEPDGTAYVAGSAQYNEISASSMMPIPTQGSGAVVRVLSPSGALIETPLFYGPTDAGTQTGQFDRAYFVPPDKLALLGSTSGRFPFTREPISMSHASGIFVSRIRFRAECSFTLANQYGPIQNIPALGGSVYVYLNQPQNCHAWAVPRDPWLSVTGNVGSWIEVTAGPAGAGRRLTELYIGTQAYVIEQQTDCPFQVSPASVNWTSAGGSAPVNVTIPSGCAWSATGLGGWFSPTSFNATGNATIPLVAPINYANAARSGGIQFPNGSVNFVTRAANPCTYEVSPIVGPPFQAMIRADSRAQDVLVTVNTGPNCPWDVLPGSASWINGSGVAGVVRTGFGTAVLTIQANTTSSSRNATITVANKAVQIWQEHSLVSSHKYIVLSGDKQQTPIGSVFPEPLRIQVLTTGGQPVVATAVQISGFYNSALPGLTNDVVNWPVTDATGIATLPLLRANSTAGTFGVSFGPPFNSATLTNTPLRKLFSPAAGSTLPGRTAVFSWQSLPGDIDYWLDVGTVQGSGDIFGGAITGNGKTVTNLPCNGSTVFVSLFTRRAAGYLPADRLTYVGTSNCGTDPRALLQHPDHETIPAATTLQFAWSPGVGALSYQIDVGSYYGASDILNLPTTNRSELLTGIPCNGAPIFVRLTTFTSTGALVPHEYYFKRPSSCSANGAYLTSPGLETVSLGRTTTFAWSTVASSQYLLSLGTAPGLADIYASGSIVGTTIQVPNIPCTGGAIHVRLLTQVLTAGQAPQSLAPRDYRFLAPTDCGAVISTPVPSSTLSGSSITFGWTAVQGALDYWLDVGTVLGQGNISAGVVTGTSKLVNNIPCNSQTIHVRLWHRTAAGYQPPRDFTYTAASICGGDPRAVLVTPAPGSTVLSAVQNFTWTAGTGALDYWLDVGTAVGQGNISAGVVTGTSKQVTISTCANQLVFVRLWTRTPAGYQSPIDYTFTCNAANPKGALTLPSAGQQLTSSTVTFTWTAGAGAQDYWLDVGLLPGQGTISAGVVNGLSKQVTGISCGNNTIHVRLWTRANGVYLSPLDYSFNCTAPGDVRAMLTAPASGSTLPSSGLIFQWSPGTNAQDYWIDIGTSQGQGNLFGGVVTGTARPFSNVPAGPGLLWIRLWTRIGGVWQQPFDYPFMRP